MALLSKSSLLFASRWALIALGFIAMFNVGCSTGMVPSGVGTAHTVQTNRWGACISAEGGVEAPAVATTGRVLVGHEKWFLPGADPFPCHHSVFHRYAAMLVFDIPREPRIRRFVLHPVDSFLVVRRGRSSGNPECTVTISIAQEVLFTGNRMPRTVPLFPGSFATDTIRIGAMSFFDRHPGIDVTSVAQDWQNGIMPNLGFVVTEHVSFSDSASSTCLYSMLFQAEVEFDE